IFTMESSKNCTSSIPTTFTPNSMAARNSLAFGTTIASMPRLSREIIRAGSKRLSMAGLKIWVRWRAISARRSRRISSSLFPLNIPPVITSIHPPLGFTPSIYICSLSRRMPDSLLSLVQLALQAPERAHRQFIGRVQVDSRLVFPQSLKGETSCLINPAQVEVRIEIALVARGASSPFKPRYRANRISLLNKVGSYIIIGIAELGIYINSSFAFLDCFIGHAHEAVGPSKKCMRLGSRIALNRFLVQQRCLVQIILKLGLISAFEILQCLFFSPGLLGIQSFLPSKGHATDACVESDQSGVFLHGIVVSLFCHFFDQPRQRCGGKISRPSLGFRRARSP